MVHSSVALIPTRLFLAVLATALLLLSPVSVQAQVLMGQPPDTSWVDSVIYQYTPPPSSPRLLPGGSVDSLGMSGLDCSGFPTICTFVDALDEDGFPLSGLTPDSFCVYQDGNPIDTFTVQQLSVDSCYTSVCLVVDISGSMNDNDKIDSAKASMHRFVSNMDTYDRVAIVSFATCVDTVIGFTSDTTALHSAITGLSASGFTAAFDGVWLGVDLTTGELGSKAVIAFTDGLENRSQSCWPPPDGVSDGTYLDDSTIICNLANSAGIPIYTFNLGPIGDTYFNPEAMQAFATGTGGSWLHAPTGSEIDSVYTQIKRRICSRYYICYQSLDTIQNGDWHTTTVCYYNAAVDSCGPCDSASCQELDVPKIVRTPPTVDLEDTCQSTTSPLTICAYVTDLDTDPEDLTVRLFYRTQAGSYTDVLMTLQPDDSTFCTTLAAGLLTCKEFVEYYLTASDGVSTVSSPASNPLSNPYHIDLCYHRPVAACPGDDTIRVCNLSPICLDGFMGFDADGDLASVTAVGGTLSGDTICFTPVVGINTLMLIATDACGRADTCSTDVTVLLVGPPLASCASDTSLTVCDLSAICLPGFACADADSSKVIGGTLSGDTVCFTPVAGVNTLKVICFNDCGTDTCTTNVTVNVLSLPVANCPGNAALSVCDLTEICLPGFYFSGGTPTVIGGTLSGDSVCFTPVDGPNVIKLISTNACGADTCQVVVNVTVTGDPVATCPGNSDQSVCDLSEVTPVPGFSYSNGTPMVIGGTLSGGTVTITNPVAGPNLIKLICTNSCGADTCETVVDITVSNEHPSPMCPGNSSQTVCDLSEVQPIPGFFCSGGTPTVTGGTLSGDTVTLTNPVAGANVIRLICASACDEDTCQTTVTIHLQDQPVCPDVPDTTSVRICEIYEYCLNLGPNASSCQVVAGPGSVSGGEWCYTPMSLNDTVTVTLSCDDGCNNACQTTFTMAFYTDESCGNCPQVCIDTLTAIPNSLASVCIRLHEGGIPWGGFDFLIGYDPSLLTLIEAEPGAFLIDCDWEYFTYRLLGGGKVRVVAIADMNNSNDHPLCLTPGPGDVIACLTFKVTADWTLACRDALLQWNWTDCADNSISDPTGEILYIASSAPGSVVNWEGVDLTGQPGLGGPPFPCPSDKGEPQECTHFCGGKIRIICPGEIDDRADLNLNSIAYEIADAVLYSNYFIQGPIVFTVNLDAQTAASDVNNDGVALTVADLVYLIRVITGDAQPIPDDLLGPKLASVVGKIDVSTDVRGSLNAVQVGSDQDLGAALFVFDVAGLSVVDVALAGRSQSMDLSYDVTGGQLRVLIFSIEDRGRIPAGHGEVLTITTDGRAPLRLASVEAATFFGEQLESHFEARVLPKEFALRQNYPNPFNPSTSFSIDFPTAIDYRLTIYNIGGQVVRRFDGHSQAGTVRIDWDGSSELGRPVASGVYFYAVEAGPYSDIRKMVLMK